MTDEDLTVCELFAGVGGFHLGLSKSGWKVVWANQWEPGKKQQWAFECYRRHFEEGGTICVNEDISGVVIDIPPVTLLVGGFPCRLFGGATNAHGIEGKKGRAMVAHRAYPPPEHGSGALHSSSYWRTLTVWSVRLLTSVEGLRYHSFLPQQLGIRRGDSASDYGYPQTSLHLRHLITKLSRTLGKKTDIKVIAKVASSHRFLANNRRCRWMSICKVKPS